ncbi:MAG: alpha/beta hydrolase [Acidimicrobiaceae bacterium]|nr:alpha/beta hydrolase [Acidimicrobiaceae bacterium]
MSAELVEVTLASGRVAHYSRHGSGDPVLYLRSMVVPAGDDVFVESLAQSFDVIVPRFPGFDSLDELDDLDNGHDVALYFDDLLRSLELDRAHVVGHSFGGLVAAELAAHFPERATSLALLAPFGLWSEEEPTPDLAQWRPATWFNRFSAEGTEPVDQEDEEHIVAAVQAMTATLKFVWPFPDHSLARRLYRISAPTRVYWGNDDPVVQVGYAARWAAAIAGAQVETLAGGHLLIQDQPEEMAERIGAFQSAAASPARA